MQCVLFWAHLVVNSSPDYSSKNPTAAICLSAAHRLILVVVPTSVCRRLYVTYPLFSTIIHDLVMRTLSLSPNYR